MSKLALRLVAGAGVLLLWQVLALSHIWPPYLFPGPADVVATLLRTGGNGQLLTAVLVTAQRMTLGFGLAAVGGVLLGLLLARYRVLSDVIGPAVRGLQSLPSICWLPMAILWLGLSETALLFVTVIGALFAVAVATEGAVTTISPGYIRAASTMGARGISLYTRVILPAALPSLLTGLRVGWSFAWRSLMAAELLFMNLGLGHLLGIGRELADAALVMAVVFVIMALGFLVDRLLFARSEAAVRRRWGYDQAA